MPDTLGFRGIATATLDAKGRMALSARHRDAMITADEGRVTVTLSLQDPCLLLYPRTAWNNVQTEVEKLPNMREATRRVQQKLIGYATDLELDGSGRLLLPSLLRNAAGLEKKVALVGQGRKIEIWNEDSWDSAMRKWLKDLQDNALDLQDNALEKLSI